MNGPKILIIEDNKAAVERLQQGILADWPSAHIDTANSPHMVKLQINPQPPDSWDVILLDHFYSGLGNFGLFDIERFGAHRVIGISSSQSGNDAIAERGVTHFATKDYMDWPGFIQELGKQMRLIVGES